MSDNIKVAIKVRPLIDREKDADLPIQWSVEGNKITQIDPETGKKCETEYTFDCIFDQGRTNEEVFNSTVKPIVEAAMQGFNGTVFAYGQTSSGKTYTMMGTKSEPGVIPLAVASIFDFIKNDQTREFVLSVSYLEIYNERINDLLDTERKDLKVREENGEIKVECKEEVTHSVEDILHVMRRGDKNRRIGETNMNERSSRSHTIFKITIGSVLRTDADGDAIVAQLNLIDLAGSERARQTGATGERFNEGRHINLSLSTLGLVIKQLSENSEKLKMHKHISYRDSKLTRILQPSLGGNSLTTIICAVTPAAGDETLCTLAFAQRAKGIKNKPKVNETGSEKALVKRFRNQIHKLEERVRVMGDQLKAKDEKLQTVEILQGRIELLKEKMLSGSATEGQENKVKCQNRRRTWGGSGTGSGTSFEFQLPTIQECVATGEKDTLSKEYIKRRQSVIQNVHLIGHDESLGQNFLDWEDFELQLIEDAQNRDWRWSSESNDADGAIDPRVTVRRVTFEDDIEQSKSVTSPDACTTPEKDKSEINSSPGTPKADLRKTLKVIQSEYDELRQYTTLEKQIFKDSSSSAESTLAFVQKSLVDTEQICKDLNKKYAELQSEHAILKREYEKSTSDCQLLKKQVETLTNDCERLNPIESERDILRNKFNETLKKLKILEDETSSHAYAMELTIKKNKARELELEASLNSAWEELNYYKSDNKNLEDLENRNLEIVVDELRKKIELANSEREQIEENQRKIVDEFLGKIENYEKIIIENNEFKENQEKIVGEFLERIEKYEREIFEKNKKLEEHLEVYEDLKLMKEKIELSNSKVKQLTEDNEEMISEFSSKIKNFESEILEKNSKIANFESEILEKNSKILVLEKEILEKNSKILIFENEILEKNSKISNFESEILERNSNISNFEEIISELSSKISNFEIEILEKNSTISNFETEILEKNSKISDFEKIISELSSKIENFEIEIKEKNSKILIFENEILESNSRISNYESEIVEKNLKISNFEEIISELSSKIKNFQSEISEKNSNQIQTQEAQKIDENQMKKSEEIENLTENLAKKTDNENTLKTQINELQLTLEETKSNLIKLETEKGELLRRIEEKSQTDSRLNKLNLTSNKTLDETSIFANASYFDGSGMDLSTASIIPSLSVSIIDPEKSILQERQLLDLNEKTRDELLSTIATIDSEYKKLMSDYKLKIRETEEIKSCILPIKIDMEKVQNTVLLLTNENAELTTKLTQQKEQLESINEKELTKNLKLIENIHILENEKIEILKKIEILENENIDLSTNLMEKIERIEILEKENVDLSTNLMEKIEEYDEIIKKLKNEESPENSKKSENCRRCAHFSELIETRRMMKNDVKSAAKKLHELHEDFQRKSADVEKLQTKAKDFNISDILNDTILNGSICESTEAVDAVAYVEEKVHKLHDELDGLKINYDKLTILYEEKCSEIEELKEDDKLLRIKEQIQRHHADVQKVKKYVDGVMKSLDKFKAEKLMTEEELNSLKTEKDIIVKNFNEERELLMEKIEKMEFNENQKKLDSRIENFEKLKLLEENIELLNTEKSKIKENYEEKISEFLLKIENYEKEIFEKNLIIENFEKNDIIIEINEARDYMKKEIISLKPDIVIDSEIDSIIKLFKLFITTIMSKEKEIIHSLQLSFRKEKEKLVEEKKELADAEKRAVLWSKELESDIERLQADLSSAECTKSSLAAEISALKNSMKELDHEKKLLDEKVRVMEADYVTLQNDLESSPKSPLSAVEIDKMVQQALLTAELDYSSRISKIESTNRLKIEEYESSISSLKTKNLELRNTIDGLAANVENMKSIIDLKTIDSEKSSTIVSKLESKLRELSDSYDRLVDDNRKSLERIDELTRLLKLKCDKLSEYKTNLEAIKPDYELLKDESIENGKRLEKYKSEIGYLREENERLALALKEAEDNWRSEIEKSASCTKQLQEVVNKNTCVQKVCEELQAKLEECVAENERLNRKVRNSTSKLTAERDIEDLKDEINRLRKSFDGASNRIAELQTSKKELTEENDELKRMVEKLKAENKELDDEMEDIVERMNDLDRENGRLETRLYEYEKKNVSDDYKTLKNDYECLMVKCDLLAKENAELKGKVSGSVESQPKSGHSSRSTSPVPSMMRRKRRSDLFNQNRPQELAKEFVVAEEIPCNCEAFRQTISQLEHELVLKKGKITAMEMKISGLCVPYKKKCEDYEEKLGLYKRSLAEMKEQVARMRERERGSECERCKGWKERRRDAGIQCIPEVITGFSAPKSGIVEDQRLIEKLERDKAKLKELCSSRCLEIKQLLRKIKDLEGKLTDTNSQLSHSSANDETKENVPVNILGQSKSISPSSHYRIN